MGLEGRDGSGGEEMGKKRRGGKGRERRVPKVTPSKQS